MPPPKFIPHLLIPVGYPSEEVQTPDIHRKPLDEILTHDISLNESSRS